MIKQLSIMMRIKSAFSEGWSAWRGSASSVADLAHGTGMPGWGQTTRPDRPYAQVVAVYAAVACKANALAQLPLRISDAQDNVIESGPLAMLAERPHRLVSAARFWRDTSAFLDLFGRAHWLKTRTARGDRVLELLPINPLQMEPVISGGQLQSWRYQPRQAASYLTLALDEVHTIIDPDHTNPWEPWFGLSPRQVAAAAIAQAFKADLANEASLDNGVQPGGALVLNATVTPDQERSLKQQLAEHHQGVLNRRRIMLLQGGWSWQEMSQAFGEMEFSKLKGMSREDICVAFGVSPLVVGWPGDSQLGAGKESDAAQRQFWFGTMMPRAEWLADEWNAVVAGDGDTEQLKHQAAARKALSRLQTRSRTFATARRKALAAERDVYAWFDASAIPAVQAAQLDLANSAAAWIDKGVPLNEIIRAYDLPFEEQAWGDTWHKPIGLVDVQADDLLADEPDGLPPTDDAMSPDDQQAERDAINNRALDSDLLVKALPESARAALHESWRRSWAPQQARMEARVKRHFMGLRAQVLAQLDQRADAISGKALAGLSTKDLIQSILFDVIEANQSLLVGVRPIIAEALRLGGVQAMTEAAAAEGQPAPASSFDAEAALVRRALRQRETRITSVNSTLERRLRAQLADAFESAEPISKVAERVRKEFNLATTRARTIAMTETGAAVEQGRAIGREQAGVPGKSWLWSRKETGREWHLQTELDTMARPVGNDELFTIAKTGNRAPHPRAAGDPEDDINCGCTTIGRYPNDRIKDLQGLRHLVTKGFVAAAQLHTKAAG